jgi:hypothetical protein
MTITDTDDETVGPDIREMLRFGERPAAPLTGIELRLRSKRSLGSRFDVKVLVAAAAVVILVALAFTAGPLHSSQHRAASPPPVPGVPHRWATYSAYGLQISVPKSWSVQYFGQCPDGQKPGTLFIGTSQSVDQCPEFGSNTGMVALYETPEPEVMPYNLAMLPAAVHGLSVEEDNASSPRYWTVPAHGATLRSSGPGSAAVLRTLAPATPQATPADGIASGTATLAGIPGGTPVTGKVEATDTHTGKQRSVLVLDGQFWFEGAPGPYRLVLTSGNTPCTITTVTVLAGQRVTAAPIVCQGD